LRHVPSSATGVFWRHCCRLAIFIVMSDVTRILSQIEQGDPQAAEKLLPLVYNDLRKLAAAKLAEENPGQTLQATALVHEAYLRLVGGTDPQLWNHRGHFFCAAAEAMRRILVESARRKASIRHGSGLTRVELDDEMFVSIPPAELLALDELLDILALHDPTAAKLVKLRCFAGLSLEQAAEALGLARSTAYRQWTYAKAWLYARIEEPKDS
jgi:RNA polymerase sigma factor (TIGR02999 family)